jgi:hypothetical protein
MNWSNYEEEIYFACLNAFPDAKVVHNVKIKGKISSTTRQIDILVQREIGGNSILIAIDCKLYNKKVNIKHVDSFIGMIEDIGADRGILVTELGYTEGALRRAHYNSRHMELDIYSLKELTHELQGEIAIPYADTNGVILFAPFGWLIDATAYTGSLCLLYQRGLTLQEAGEQKELAYVNFWDKKKSSFNLNELVDYQEKYMRKTLPVKDIKYLETIKRGDASTLLRIAEIDNYPGIELTAFVEFEDFIFFCVWFSREVVIKRNIRKLETLIKSAIPVKIEKS